VATLHIRFTSKAVPCSLPPIVIFTRGPGLRLWTVPRNQACERLIARF